MIVKPVLLLLLASYGAADTTAVEWENYDKCTNECDDDNSSYWCGERRSNEEGISRCVQFTKMGDPCVSKCQGWKDEKYKWCMTNSIKLSSSKWWDHCSEEGFTINQEKCVDECAKREEDYFWCHTEKGWDHCSPPGQVQPMQMTIKGGLCKSNCTQYENTYYWCTRSLSFCKTKSEESDKCDDYWEYCSPDYTSTIFGKPCKDKCAQEGKPHYSCNTVDGSSDYCSPKAEAFIKVEREFTIYGKECKTFCGTHGEEYNWCKQMSHSSESWWDYCAPHNMTMHNEPCIDECGRRGQSYFWCHTQSSWDYCSPNKDTLNKAVSSKCGHLIFAILTLWFINAILH